MKKNISSIIIVTLMLAAYGSYRIGQDVFKSLFNSDKTAVTSQPEEISIPENHDSVAELPQASNDAMVTSIPDDSINSVHYVKLMSFQMQILRPLKLTFQLY